VHECPGEKNMNSVKIKEIIQLPKQTSTTIKMYPFFGLNFIDGSA
tara:strand:- start:300 stop:434 length:135 start_codon:yes stop_codon:yes gene_type:complete